MLTVAFAKEIAAEQDSTAHTVAFRIKSAPEQDSNFIYFFKKIVQFCFIDDEIQKVAFANLNIFQSRLFKA